MGVRGYPNFGYIMGSQAYMANSELRFPVLRSLTLGFPFGDFRLPEFQGALFFDAARAWFRDPGSRPLIGSYGFGVRLALFPLAVLRLDVGRRYSNGGFGSYGLSAEDQKRGFVSFFFGYNY
jgi:outer membrane protein assembly factor BamA